MNNCFIILAAGESKRFKSITPKPYYLFKGKPLIQHSINGALNCKKFNKIIVVINKKHLKFIKNLKLKNIKIVIGGKTRAESAYTELLKVSKKIVYQKYLFMMQQDQIFHKI